MMAEKIKKNNSYVAGKNREEQVELIIASFRIRVFVLFLGIISAGIIQNIIGIVVPREVWLIFCVWLLTSALYLVFFKFGFCKTRAGVDKVHFSYYFFGILYATTLVHYFGGAEWIAFFIYLFDLTYANVLLRRSKGALITLLMGACYLLLLFLEFKGIIPHARIFMPAMMACDNLKYVLSTDVVVITVVFFLMSYSMGFFSKMKESRENSLIESKNAFELKSRQLERVARVLRKKIEENKYIKRTTAEYIKKKEFELNMVKKDLEGQIDKLRKTQESMLFMREDINSMSNQLKEGRDHLEDKVRERTDELLEIGRKLHRSERLAFLGKLAGSVTHELRNPLAVLKNAVYFLKRKFKQNKDKEILANMVVIEKEITIIDSIMDDIMGFARTKTSELKKIKLKNVIKDALSRIKIPEFVRIEEDYEELPEIKIDTNQVKHAIVNIINNAIMAMNGNGVLTFRLRKNDNYACVEIEDTGQGISPDERDLIFEPLYSSKPKGTGLGLPIAKMMIENQGGKIEFESEPAKGTLFKIFLPIDREGEGARNG
ncbi:MAG: ATP-binding protein [Candidatus Omnitrophota bacterium]